MKPFTAPYLAAQYARRAELATYAGYLRNYGLITTSRWLNGDLEALPGWTEGTYCQPWDLCAVVDYCDLQQSDTILFFSEDPTVGIVRGARHVEFGLALAWGKQAIVIGPIENIFHTLPGVLCYQDWESFTDALQHESWVKKTKKAHDYRHERALKQRQHELFMRAVTNTSSDE